MSVFIWEPNGSPDDPNANATAVALPATECQLCGVPISEGEWAWHWLASRHDGFLCHASCVKREAAGIVSDIGRCIRHG